MGPVCLPEWKSSWACLVGYTRDAVWLDQGEWLVGSKCDVASVCAHLCSVNSQQNGVGRTCLVDAQTDLEWIREVVDYLWTNGALALRYWIKRGIDLALVQTVWSAADEARGPQAETNPVVSTHAHIVRILHLDPVRALV